MHHFSDGILDGIRERKRRIGQRPGRMRQMLLLIDHRNRILKQWNGCEFSFLFPAMGCFYAVIATSHSLLLLP